ncbi:MAG: hypothetical protein K2P01_04855, partial [Oscillospiraceae bacterium]|nr:hypothetical protein [Oscillospiraceae bacterium]
GPGGNPRCLDPRPGGGGGGWGGVALISSLEDYLYENGDFFDTNYHLVTQAARENTALWLRDLRAQMERDGVWEGV